MTITPEQLTAWRALADQATPGKWARGIGNSCHKVFDQHGNIVMNEDGYTGTQNGSFIAAARTAVPALIQECERLRATAALATEALSQWERESGARHARDCASWFKPAGVSLLDDVLCDCGKRQRDAAIAALKEVGVRLNDVVEPGSA